MTTKRKPNDEIEPPSELLERLRSQLGLDKPEIQKSVEDLLLSIKNTNEKVRYVRSIGKKHGLPKELVDEQIDKALQAQGFETV